MENNEIYKLAVKRLKKSHGDDFIKTLKEDVLKILVGMETAHIEKEKEAQQTAKEMEKMAKELEGFRALERHDRRVAKSAEIMRDIMSRQDPSRISFHDPGRVERFVGIPLTLDCSCEFSNVEPKPDYLAKGHVGAFRRESIDGLKPKMISMFEEAFSYEPRQRRPIAYFFFDIWDDVRRYASTPAVDVESTRIDDSLNLLHNHFKNLIHRIEEQDEGYEEIMAGNKVTHTRFHFVVKYYPEPQCINNWGTGIKAVEKCPLFDLFTANDENNCILQCARRIWGEDAKEDCIAKLIERSNRKVCILHPRHNVQNVFNITSYSDLVVSSISPIKEISVIASPDIIYLLEWKGHLAVLENMKEQKRNRFRTSFRPLQKYPKCKRVTVCFDIECYFDPHSKTEGTRHVPYLCCACFVYDDEPGNVIEFEGRDCVAQMIDWTAELAEQFCHKSIELIAHNGGGYDFHYILNSIYNPSAVKDIMIRNNNFISFKFKHMDIQFSVKDSLNFLLCSLSKAAKAFLQVGGRSAAPCALHKEMSCLQCKQGADLIGKTDFPHHEVRSVEDLQRTFQKWVSVDRTIDVSIEKEKMLITAKNFTRYSEDKESRRLIDWAKEYCCNDVIVLAKVWVKFKQTVAGIFNCHIVDQTYTLAGLSFRLFEAHLPRGIYLHHPIKEDFMNMRKSLVGGRCISVNGMYEDVVCLDVKSLYPAAMAFYDQPYGACRRVTKEIEHELGIYHCEVTPYGLLSEANRHSRLDSKRHGFFPLRTSDGSVTYRLGSDSPAVDKSTDNKKSSETYGIYRGWYTSVDIQIGRNEGHRICPVTFDGKHVGYSWKNKGKIFKDYIQNVLYKLKLKYEECGDKEKRQVIKIIMNSLWGKFAQKWMDTKYKIVNEDDADLGEECYKISDTDHMLVKKHQKLIYSQKPVQNGVFTLSWARWHMKLLWDSLTSKDQFGNEVPLELRPKMIYSDTDSIMVQDDKINTNAKFMLDGEIIDVIGTNVGQLEQEYKFDEVICVGKKQYMGKYYSSSPAVGEPTDNKSSHTQARYKFRFKGVPQQYIRPEMYTHLLENPSNEVQIDFLKFKREWGAVHGYIESKVVTQT